MVQGRTMGREAQLTDYAELKAQVRVTLVLGQQQIEAAKVLTYWRTGWAIRTHITLRGARADYGKRVLERLGKDLRVHVSVLRRCVQFAEQLPQLFETADIRAGRRESSQLLALQQPREAPLLSWSHYRVLITVADEKRRNALLQQAARQQWSAATLEERIRQDEERQAADGKPPELLPPKRGTIGLFQIKEIKGSTCLSLGFESYRKLTEAQARGLSVGDLVRYAADETLTRATDAKPADLYTYEARLARVVDGDTLSMMIRLTGNLWRREKLRLRGIDCAERGTRRGDAATRFVEAQFAAASRIVITSTKPDKWDRYLSDIYLTIAGTEVFLNNALLTHGHARRYDDVSLEDWES